MFASLNKANCRVNFDLQTFDQIHTIYLAFGSFNDAKVAGS